MDERHRSTYLICTVSESYVYLVPSLSPPITITVSPASMVNFLLTKSAITRNSGKLSTIRNRKEMNEWMNGWMDEWTDAQIIIGFAFTSYHDDYICLSLEQILIISAYIM